MFENSLSTVYDIKSTNGFVGCRHIYICKDNDLSNCSIIFITIAQYTQMYWNNRTALAEDNTATPWSVYWSATRELITESSLMLRPTVSRPVCLGIKHPCGAYDQIFISVWKTEYVWQLRIGWFLARDWLAVYSGLFTATRLLPSNHCLPGCWLASAKRVWLVATVATVCSCVWDTLGRLSYFWTSFNNERRLNRTAQDSFCFGVILKGEKSIWNGISRKKQVSGESESRKKYSEITKTDRWNEVRWLVLQIHNSATIVCKIFDEPAIWVHHIVNTY
jgi:hypothetical protein